MINTLKSQVIKFFLSLKDLAYHYKLTYQYRKVIRLKLKNKPLQLSKSQRNAIKDFYDGFGYKKIKTCWHEFNFANNNLFSVKYVPEDLFHAVISKKFNQMRQWPALLDKNLLGLIFKNFKQPGTVLKNINGFYFIDGKLVLEDEAISLIVNKGHQMVIKPSIESGNGQGVLSISPDADSSTNIKKLFRRYKKDFMVQEIVNQHNILKQLNPSSLNTIRVMSYLNEKGAYILSSVLRIGSSESFIDNFEAGGVACGIDENGILKDQGYRFCGTKITKTDVNVLIGGIEIPRFNNLVKQVKEMHKLIPYFRLVSWDIGIDNIGDPVLIEYNTYHQDISMHQLANGPLFGKFTEEILQA